MRESEKKVARAFIQARMSSRRFPGKVLAPFKGRPVIHHLISQVKEVIPSNQVVVATSTDPTDDPLACYVQQLGISVFRGPLDNVFERFKQCLKKYPCDWFFRLCGDSPLLDKALLRAMLTYCDKSDIDLVTNVYPRTFPKGRSLELLKAEPFSGIDSNHLSDEEKEHLTKAYYNHPETFRILNLTASDASLAKADLAIDTVEDLLRLETFPEKVGGPL